MMGHREGTTVRATLRALFAMSALTLAACSSDRAGAPPLPAGAPGPVSLKDGPALEVVGADGSVVLASIHAPQLVNELRYDAFGFSTAPEPELVPPSFDPVPVTPAPAASARHSATRIRKTTPQKDGFVALLDTDDPSGRTLTVAVSKVGALVHVDVTVDPPAEVTAVHASFQTPQTEAFHGFGGRRESTDLRGKLITNWVFDYRFPRLDTAYYYPQPMFLSSAGYALWLDTERMATFRMATDVPDAFRVSVADSALHLVLATEGGVPALKAITAVTGRHAVPPSWSTGPALSRTIQLYVDEPDVYRSKVTADVARITTTNDDLVEAYAYEGWAQLPPEFVAETNATLKTAGIHPMLYIRSFVANDTAGTEPTGRFDDAIAKGYVATHQDGSPYAYPDSFPGADAAVVDFTNPDAVAWWKGFVTDMLESGADGFMCDFGEQVLPDMVFQGGTGAEVHNRFPVLQHRAAREAVDAFRAAHPERELFFFVRSGYAGSPGSAAYESATFPGDESSDWNPETGLPSIVPDMLNRSIFGAYGFTADIGGYADFTGKGPSEELFVRWLEATVFMTHVRVHNSALTGVKMPWSYGDDTEGTWRQMAALHNRSRRLVEELWKEAQTSGGPPMRPLWLDDATNEARAHQDDEWLVGKDLLVAPVLTEAAISRDVYFPEGCWALHGDGAEYRGPTTRSLDAPLRTLLWFTRCGTTLGD